MNKHLKFATLLANALDNTFSIGGIRFGFAALINVIPGIGDFIDVFLSLYLVWIARQLKVPQIRIAQMLWNILISFLIGLVPVVGDVTYLFRRANLRNLGILKKYAAPNIVEGKIVG